MALSPEEITLVERLRNQLTSTASADELMLRYYMGRQRVEQLGMAIPPSMRKFLVIANWPRVVVRTINERQQVRSLVLPGEDDADPQLRAIMDASNMDAHLSMFNADRMIYGRAFMSVGSNEDDESLPLIRVESPREMAALVDIRHETVIAAARFYGTDEYGQTPTNVTLYRPNVTIWVERASGGKWREVDRDEHMLGRVPVVMHLNGRMSGAWVGESQMSDVIPLTDSVARSLTNMQFAQESHGVPRMFMTGVSQGDFVDKDGKPIPKFEAYFNAIHTLKDKDASVGQLSGADLKNFETALTTYGRQAATVTGFPGRYFGLTTVNPSSEGAIRAEESGLVRTVEDHNAQVGMSLGWVAALALRFATGDWVEGNRVRVDWFDPATPTVAQRMDAIVKAKQSGILSREGSWDELGWSEPRKVKERAYFEAEANDPFLDGMADKLAGGGQSTDADEIKKRADAMGVLIRAGVEVTDAANRVGLTGTKFTGAVPVSLRLPESEAHSLEGKSASGNTPGA